MIFLVKYWSVSAVSSLTVDVPNNDTDDPVNHAVYEDAPAPIRDMSLAQWRNTFEANLTSSFLLIRAFLRQLDRLSPEQLKKVAIVLIGSTAGKFGEASASSISLNEGKG